MTRKLFHAAALALVVSPSLAQVELGELEPVEGRLRDRRWSDKRTWPGQHIPAAGDCVVIPAGWTVLLDVSPPPLAGLDVAGVLRFSDTADRALTSDWIRVTGALEIGTEETPFVHRATVTLTADFATSCSVDAEDRTLAVEGTGRLDLHGEPRVASWTHLATTAAAGATQIDLATDPGWRVGDVIVIAPGDFYFHEPEADERTITAIEGTTLSLDAPLEFEHWAQREGVQYDGVGIDERCEVGLLTRNVVVQGVPITTPEELRIAGQTRFHEAGAVAPLARIEWAEFRSLGDELVLGHYPLHFHQVGDATGSYVKNASIHHCFNRWLSIHTTQNVVVEGCVGFDTIGHGFYFEDEFARGCTMRRNLGIATHAVLEGTGLHEDDKASAFWLIHPDNVIVDNAAAGNGFAGFWFDTADNETAPWLAFERNVAHSNGDTGFYGNNKPTPAPASVLRDCVAWKNRDYGYWIRSHESFELVNCDSADNRGGFYLASSGFQVDTLGRDGLARIRLIDSLVIGESQNAASFPQLVQNAACLGYPRWDALSGVELYDGMVSIEGCTFAGFADRPAPNGLIRKAGALTPTWYASPWGVDPRNRVIDCTFIDDGVTATNPLWLRTPTGTFVRCNGALKGDQGVASTVLYDATGSLTGSADRYVVPVTPFLAPRTPGTFVADWNAYVVDGPPANVYGQLEYNAIIPDAVEAQLALAGVVLPAVTARIVKLSAPMRGVSFPIVAPRETQNQTVGSFQPRYPVSVVANETYDYAYEPETPPSPIARWFQVTFQFARPGDFVLVAVPLPPPTQNGAFQLDINGSDVSLAPAADLATLEASTGNGWWYEAATERIWLRLELESANGGMSIYDSLSTTATALSY